MGIVCGWGGCCMWVGGYDGLGGLGECGESDEWCG